MPRSARHPERRDIARPSNRGIQSPYYLWCHAALYEPAPQIQETLMDHQPKPTTASKDVITFAKKHRIEIEDAQNILAQYGDDRKNADKAARRIAA